MFKFISSNRGKIKEFEYVFEKIPHQIVNAELEEIQDLDPEKVVRFKIKEALKIIEPPFVLEDTSLFFSCLNGLPGTYVKAFYKKLKNIGMYDLVHKYPDHSARGLFCAGYVNEKNVTSIFTCEVTGSIVYPRGELGSGWDPIMLPENSSFTLGEMTFKEKENWNSRIRLFLDLRKDIENGKFEKS